MENFKLSRFNLHLSTAVYCLLLTTDALSEVKHSRYFMMAFGDITYTINGLQPKYPLTDGMKKTLTYAVGTKLCATSKKGLLVLKDVNRIDHYISHLGGCYTVNEINKPTYTQKIKRAFSNKEKDGEDSISGITFFSQIEGMLPSTKKEKGTKSEDYNIYLSNQNSLTLIHKKWITSNNKLPIKLQVMSRGGNMLLEQMSNTHGFTYFVIPADLVPKLQGALLEVTNKTDDLLMKIEMGKDDKGSLVYIDMIKK